MTRYIIIYKALNGLKIEKEQADKCWLKYRKCWWYKYLPPEQKLFGGKVKR